MGGVDHLLAEVFALVGSLVSMRGSFHLAEGYSPEKEIAVSCHKPVQLSGRCTGQQKGFEQGTKVK